MAGSLSIRPGIPVSRLRWLARTENAPTTAGHPSQCRMGSGPPPGPSPRRPPAGRCGTRGGRPRRSCRVKPLRPQRRPAGGSDLRGEGQISRNSASLIGRHGPERCGSGRPPRDDSLDSFRNAFRPGASGDDVGRIAPAHDGRMLRGVERPVAGTGRAVDATGDAVAGRVAIDLGCGEEGAQLEVEVARGQTIGAGEDRSQQLAALDGFAYLDGERVVEVAVHRVEAIRVSDDDDEAGVLRSGEDDIAGGHGIDAQPARLPVGRYQSSPVCSQPGLYSQKRASARNAALDRSGRNRAGGDGSRPRACCKTVAAELRRVVGDDGLRDRDSGRCRGGHEHPLGVATVYPRSRPLARRVSDLGGNPVERDLRRLGRVARPEGGPELVQERIEDGRSRTASGSFSSK